MRPQRRSAAMAVGTLAAVLTTAGLSVPAAGQPHTPGPRPAAGTGSDLGTYSTDYFSRHRELDLQGSQAEIRRARAQAAGQGGAMRLWPAEDFVDGSLYLKRYQLRGVGKHIQIWVANDRAFPTDDCRNDLGITDISDRQVKAFIHEFDDNILPVESKAFSVAPNRNGRHSAGLAKAVGLRKDYWQVGKRRADDTVVLVDNVRDENYYTPNTPEGQTRVAGFFSSEYTALFDRNIMTIDSYDWLHQTGANPPDDSKRSAYVECGEELGAPAGRAGSPNAWGYEGTFAHEYQHLLESYEDFDESSWVNEGLSDYAQTLTGYVDPSLDPARKIADSHIACFSGYNGRRFGGPENSLTLWGDQGDPEILCDYGAAYSFMQYLYDHFGGKFLSKLHRNDTNGIAGLQRVIDARGGKVDVLTLFHRWSAAMALDEILDDNGGRLVGGPAQRYRSDSLTGRINWNSPQAYDQPGAPTNGSDFVRLRDADGSFLTADQVDTVDFAGGATYEPEPVEWIVDTASPESTTEDTACGTVPGGGATALYSGCGDLLDRSIVREVSIPDSGAPTISFDALWDVEEGWDFAFVQVSTDGGATWTSLSTEDTTSEHDPEALPYVVSELPGLTGDSGTWKSETADLSAYQGQDVLIGFRYITDPAAAEAGMWLRNIDVAGTPLPSDSLDGWRTITQVHPLAVPGFTVQLVSYGTPKQAAYLDRLALDDAFHGALSGDAVANALGTKGSVVAAIVTADDVSEKMTRQAPYTLTVNGVVQPGGPAG